VQAPTIVRASFWTAIVGLSIIVIAAVLALAAKDTSIAIEIGRPNKTLTDEQIRQAITTQVWLTVGFSLVLGLLAAYFVRKVLDGERKARTRFMIVSILLLLFLFFFGNIIALVGLVALMVALGLIFSGTATRFLNEQ
jgi:NhaP-type Na+/H+ or K+/H+ antiporter